MPLGAYDHLCEVLDFVMPWPNGCAVMLLMTYLDASKREKGVYCVGAIGFRQAKKATRRWINLWGDTVCHMTDLNSRAKGTAFEHWTPQRAGERLKDTITAINATATLVVTVSCHVDEIDRLAPKTSGSSSRVLLGGFSNAYAVCSHLAMCSVAKLLGDGTDVAYFFESGDDGQSGSQRFIAALAEHPQASHDLYKYRSHTVLSKKDSRLFEVADVVAWEWAKHVERTEAGIGMRPSLRALLGDESQLAAKGPINLESETRRGWHTTGEPLERYFRRVRELGLLED